MSEPSAPDQPTAITYAAAGVDVEAGDRAVELMKASVRRATRPEVLGGLGGFAGMFDASGLRAYRPVIMGTRGAVACGHPLAAQAGTEALRHGASAADAAVVVASTLAVVEPMMSGVAGDGYFLHYSARDGRAEVINATGPAPQEASAEAFAGGLNARRRAPSDTRPAAARSTDEGSGTTSTAPMSQ